MRPVDILTRHNLKRTSCREGIIEVIMSAENPLSESEIRKRLNGHYDRSTFYRSFKALEENKIIHKIVVDNQLVKYALDNSITRKREHVHFYCYICHTVQCLESVPVQKTKLPDGYTEQEKEVLIKGICARCQNKVEWN